MIRQRINYFDPNWQEEWQERKAIIAEYERNRPPRSEWVRSKFAKHPLFPRLAGIFNGMKQRCYYPLNDAFDYYGGRGITICDEWLNDMDAFIGWALENGYKLGLTIDRIDNYRGYEKSNCRWVTNADNQRNKRCHQDAREALERKLKEETAGMFTTF